MLASTDSSSRGFISRGNSLPTCSLKAVSSDSRPTAGAPRWKSTETDDQRIVRVPFNGKTLTWRRDEVVVGKQDFVYLYPFFMLSVRLSIFLP